MNNQEKSKEEAKKKMHEVSAFFSYLKLIDNELASKITFNDALGLKWEVDKLIVKFKSEK